MLKSGIRKYYLDKRKTLSKEEIEYSSRTISQIFFDSVDLTNIKIIHCFLPITKFKEINTWYIIHEIWNKYPSIKIATSITESDKLIHVLINKDTKYVDDKWGIPTPLNCKKINPNEIDLIITPLLAFDKNYNRVGYGKGYYDKFFSECKVGVNKIGVSLFPVLENKIEDTNPFDIRLNKVITF